MGDSALHILSGKIQSMNSARTIPVPTSRHTAILPRVSAAIVFGWMLFFVIAGAFVFSFQLRYEGRIFPGVSVAGIDVSGKAPAEAASLIAQRLVYPQQGRIALKDGSSVWVVTPAELGLTLDASTTAHRAYAVGRSGNLLQRLSQQLTAFTTGQTLAPVLVYDERVAQEYLAGLAAMINRSTLEASLGIDGARVTVNSGQVGRELDVEATLAAIAPQLHSMTDGVIPLTVHETPPIILDATQQAEIAQEMLSEPLVIKTPEAQSGRAGYWQIEPETLAGMLSIERVVEGEAASYQVRLDSEQLRTFIANVAPSLAVQPVNARFSFNDETRELDLLEPHVTGRAVLVDETVQAIQDTLANGGHSVEIVFDYQDPPAKSDATAAELGITELVSAQTSYFYGSSSPRIQNIAAASGEFHGLLVAPGQTFSMAEVLGDISLDNGYAEALIIYGDRTIKGVGGGVCQVSTTLFRTVFFGGYEITERHPHAYRVYYYELSANGSVNNNLAGLDATVYVPLVDFKFTNDSNNWLLMETYVNTGGRSLTWKFYSTSDGRTVEWTTTGLKNRVDPPDPIYKENPDLKKGEVDQVDWAVDGADVTVRRTVIRDGTTLHEDVITTHYRPWRAVYEYGPGTKGMPPDDEE